MIDDECSVNESLPWTVYEKIEKAVFELFRRLGINSFPIDPFEIAMKLGCELLPYSKIDSETLKVISEIGESGLSFRKGIYGNYLIFYNDFVIKARQRFTIMHEIGHIILGHKESSQYAEKCANYFAAYALAPTPMIGRLNCEDYIDVAKRFDVSKECADISFARYLRWANLPIAKKPYEKDLENLFR